MARINIEDKLFRDPRYLDLVETLGRWQALGALTEVFIVCQQFFISHGGVIPKDEWTKRRLCQALIEVNLVIEKPTGYYVCGALEQFAWLKQKSDAGKWERKPKSNISGNQTNGRSTGGNGEQPLTLTLTHKKNTYVEEEPPTPKGEWECLVDIWNQNRGPLPGVKSTSKRLTGMKARWKDNPDAAYWTDIVKKIASSEFCTGRTGGSWKADFDWLLKRDIHIKVSEGSYGCGSTKPKFRTIESIDEL